MKEITYYDTHSFTLVANGKKETASTAQYQTGVYVIFNDDHKLQFSMSPEKISKYQKDLMIAAGKGEIKHLTFGRKITVTKKTDYTYVKKIN